MRKSILGIFTLQILVSMAGCTTLSSLSTNAIPRTSVGISGSNGYVNTPYGSVNTQSKKPNPIQLGGQFLRKSKDTTFIITLQKVGIHYQATFTKATDLVDTLKTFYPLSTYQIGKDFAFLNTQNKVVLKYVSGYPNGVQCNGLFYKQFILRWLCTSLAQNRARSFILFTAPAKSESFIVLTVLTILAIVKYWKLKR